MPQKNPKHSDAYKAISEVSDFSLARQLKPNTNVKALRDGVLLVVRFDL